MSIEKFTNEQKRLIIVSIKDRKFLLFSNYKKLFSFGIFGLFREAWGFNSWGSAS